MHTVDRHLVRTVVEASRLTTSVRRADLLLLAALLHDIGKGHPGDHCVTGAEMVRPIAGRLGCDDDDVATLSRIVRHHLLFARASTRRDPDDAATASGLVAILDGDPEALDVLAALTVADAIATGPTVWTSGRAAANAALVEACRAAPSARPAAVEAPTVEAAGPHGPPTSSSAATAGCRIAPRAHPRRPRRGRSLASRRRSGLPPARRGRREWTSRPGGMRAA